MHTKTRGVVLISVLMIVLLLSSIAMLLGNKYLLSLKRAQYIEFQSHSLNIFGNVETIMKNKIEEELRFSINKLSKSNRIFRESIFFKIDNSEIIGTISDASGCFNINSLVIFKDGNFIENPKSIAAYSKLLELMEVDNNLISESVDQIIDWIDRDALQRANGLEDYYYTGPLHNPREYSGMRLLISIDELKSIPAVRGINWNIYEDNFCALPIASNISININTLDQNDTYLLASIFPNIDLNDAAYIIDNIPKDGFDNFDNFSRTFPELDFESPNGNIDYKSKVFSTKINIYHEDFQSSSQSIIMYENNKNGYIVARIYNGI